MNKNVCDSHTVVKKSKILFIPNEIPKLRILNNTNETMQFYFNWLVTFDHVIYNSKF